MNRALSFALHAVVLFAAPPLLLGVVNRTKARFAGRTGPPLLQPYWDILRLLRKGMVLSTTTTWMFFAGPIVALVTAVMASLFVPMGPDGAFVSFTGDLIVFAYLLGLGRFFTVAAAFDTGSPFEGMGAVREATFSCLAEPALLVGLLVLVRQTASASLGTMLGPELAAHSERAAASLVVVAASAFIVLLAESSRMPVDDPNTHLELTMIHEVMVLDHSGPLLALVEYGAATKLFALAAIVARLALPLRPRGPLVDWMIFAGGVLAVAVAIGVVESTMARLRIRQVPSLLVAACLLSGFGIVLLTR